MKRRLILLMIPFCIFMLCGMIPQKAMEESVSLSTGSNSSMLATDSNPEETLYTISGFFKQLYPHWKKTILLEPEEELELNRLPVHILYMSDNGSIPLEINWDPSSADLTETGLHYISGTPVLPSDCIFSEDFDGTAYWPVFRAGDEAVLPVTPEDPEIYDSLIELGGNPETELRIAASDQQYYVGEDGYVDAAAAPVWQWDYSEIDVNTPGRYRISGTPSFPEGYVLAENYKKEFTVFVLPTDCIELFAATEISGRGSRLYLDWLYTNHNYQTSILEMETSDGNWEACDSSWYTCRTTYLALHINLFPKNIPISIRLRYQNSVDNESLERVTNPVVITIPSNIQELYDSMQLDSSAIAELVNGDRDGGDSDGSKLPSIEQPLPVIPDDIPDDVPDITDDESGDTDDKTGDSGDGSDVMDDKADDTDDKAGDSGDGSDVMDDKSGDTDDEADDILHDSLIGTDSGEVGIPDRTPTKADPNKSSDQESHQDTAPETVQPIYEIVTDSYTAISGLRLKALTALGPTVLFEKQGVSVEIPSKLIEQAQLGDYDLFEITIQYPQKNAFQIDAQINGIPFESLDGTMVYLPWESGESYRYEIINSSGIVLSEAIYKEEQGLLCVLIDRPDVYFLTEIQEPTVVSKEISPTMTQTKSESAPPESEPPKSEPLESQPPVSQPPVSQPPETFPAMVEPESESESVLDFGLWLIPAALLLGSIFLILRRWKHHD